MGEISHVNVSLSSSLEKSGIDRFKFGDSWRLTSLELSWINNLYVS